MRFQAQRLTRIKLQFYTVIKAFFGYNICGCVGVLHLKFQRILKFPRKAFTTTPGFHDDLGHLDQLFPPEREGVEIQVVISTVDLNLKVVMLAP